MNNTQKSRHAVIYAKKGKYAACFGTQSIFEFFPDDMQNMQNIHHDAKYAKSDGHNQYA